MKRTNPWIEILRGARLIAQAVIDGVLVSHFQMADKVTIIEIVTRPPQPPSLR